MPKDGFILWEVISHSFPKNLRFCKQCFFFYTQLQGVQRKHKDRRYIPMHELREIQASWVPVPYRIMRFPVLKGVTFITLLNSMRVYKGYPSWFMSHAVEVEHARFSKWLDSQEPRKGVSTSLIDREKFEKEYLASFHVAATWHRVFLFGAVLTVTLFFALLAGLEAEAVLGNYFWLRGYTRADVKAWIRSMLLDHTNVEVLPQYKSIVGNFAFLDGSKIRFRGLELVHPEGGQSVLLLPCAWAGPKEFFELMGDLCLMCDSILMEKCALNDLKSLPPVEYFPLKEPLFPSLGLQHRFCNIIRSDKAPPQLLPSKGHTPLYVMFLHNMVPMLFRNLVWARSHYGSKSDARVAWGYLKKYAALTRTDSNGDVSYAHPKIAVPWSVWQIPNFACSLVRQGYSIKKEVTYLWLDIDEVADRFCDRFHLL